MREQLLYKWWDVDPDCRFSMGSAYGEQISSSHGSKCETKAKHYHSLYLKVTLLTSTGLSQLWTHRCLFFHNGMQSYDPTCCNLGENILESSHSLSFNNKMVKKKKRSRLIIAQSFRDGSCEGAMSPQSGRSSPQSGRSNLNFSFRSHQGAPNSLSTAALPELL